MTSMNTGDQAARPLRLLLNALHMKSGGGITYLRNMVPLLAAVPDVDLHLCIHEDQRSLVPEGLDGVSVHALGFRTGFWRLLVREQLEVPRLARRIGAAVTFSPANYGPLLAPGPVILLRNALGVAFVERRPAKLAYWAGVSLATAVSLVTCRRAIAVSRYARDSIASGLLASARRRITVVHHGVSPRFSPPPAGAQRGDFLLAVSDIYIQKNLGNLLAAVARLRDAHPTIALKVAGRPIDRDYFASLEALIAREGLADHVEFLGPVVPEALAQLYRRCRAFVFPSTVETFGNPLVEAMASGAPIACSNAAAMPEVVDGAAVLFDPADVAGMAAALDRLLRDPDLRSELGDKAAARAKAFSWQATADQTLAVIREAAGGS
jgi:glycosyltransferase involved in cell wall biosynthesis